VGNADLPYEFTEEGVREASVDAFVPYREFLRSGEPYATIYTHNTWLMPPKAGEELEWGKGWYYDTTVARKHPDWMHVSLPEPTKDLQRLRHDLHEWGYCLVHEGLSAEQAARMRARIHEQAAAERALGIAYISAAQQHLWALVNKGADFEGMIEHRPEAVQGGRVIEQLLDDFLGKGWNHFSLLSNISHPGCHPQAMHMDQTFIAPFHPSEAPVLVNSLYVLQDVNEHNGGTLLIPGSHRIRGTLPRPINLEASAGTVVVFDGRLMHGGAVNHSRDFRYVITNSCVKPWIRQQENFLLTVSPEVLARATPKFLWRLGLQSTITAGLVEGYGYRGTGRQGDPLGSLGAVRRQWDTDGYHHVGMLTMDDVNRLSGDDFTVGRLQRQHEAFRDEEHLRVMAALGG